MAVIDSVNGPLVLRHPDGREELIAACFTHPRGLLYLDLYWHTRTPNDAAHLIVGQISGEGPWRVGDTRLRTLGCPNTDPHLQTEATAWRRYLEDNADAYPPRAQIIDIARRLGATPLT